MKVYIGKPRYHWISPYTMLDYAFFWTDWSKCARDRRIRSLEEERNYVERPDWCDRWADYLNPISLAIQWFLDRIHPKIDYVKIDYWDTWSMDHTLSPIILPMLKQLKETQHGAGFVDDDDVPEELKSTSAPPKENEWGTDANHFRRWDWILDEMIFAHESKCNDRWQDQFYTGVADYVHEEVEDEKYGKLYQMKEGPNHTQKVDWDGMKKMEERIQNGFRLFGKYYQNLWD